MCCKLFTQFLLTSVIFESPFCIKYQVSPHRVAANMFEVITYLVSRATS